MSINTAGFQVAWESPASGWTLHTVALLRGVFDFPGLVHSEMSVGPSKVAGLSEAW